MFLKQGRVLRCQKDKGRGKAGAKGRDKEQATVRVSVREEEKGRVKIKEERAGKQVHKVLITSKEEISIQLNHRNNFTDMDYPIILFPVGFISYQNPRKR